MAPESHVTDARLDFPLRVALTREGVEQVVKVGTEHAAKMAVATGAHPPVGIVFGRYRFPDGNRIALEDPFEVVPVMHDTNIVFDVPQQQRFFSTMHKVGERIDAYAAAFVCEMVLVEPKTKLPEGRGRHAAVRACAKDMDDWVKEHGSLSEHVNPATVGSVIMLTVEHVALPEQRRSFIAEVTRSDTRRIIRVGSWHPFDQYDEVQIDPLLPVTAWVPEDKRSSLSKATGNA